MPPVQKTVKLCSVSLEFAKSLQNGICILSLGTHLSSERFKEFFSSGWFIFVGGGFPLFLMPILDQGLLLMSVVCTGYIPPASSMIPIILVSLMPFLYS